MGNSSCVPQSCHSSNPAILCLDVEVVSDGTYWQLSQLGAVLSRGGQTSTFGAQVRNRDPLVKQIFNLELSVDCQSNRNCSRQQYSVTVIKTHCKDFRKIGFCGNVQDRFCFSFKMFCQSEPKHRQKLSINGFKQT
jgi:hypothetical protein